MPEDYQAGFLGHFLLLLKPSLIDDNVLAHYTALPCSVHTALRHLLTHFTKPLYSVMVSGLWWALLSNRGKTSQGRAKIGGKSSEIPN